MGHPNIINLLEVFENTKYVLLVMEYASNGDLLNYLKIKNGIAEDEGRKLFRQIAFALRFVHRNGIIHRDIKLDNILLDELGRCKLCDFGVSRSLIGKEMIRE